MHNRLVRVAFSVLLALPAAGRDSQGDVESDQCTDCTIVLRECTLAEQGDTGAQNNLGVAYEAGRGVRQD